MRSTCLNRSFKKVKTKCFKFHSSFGLEAFFLVVWLTAVPEMIEGPSSDWKVPGSIQVPAVKMLKCAWAGNWTPNCFWCCAICEWVNAKNCSIIAFCGETRKMTRKSLHEYGTFTLKHDKKIVQLCQIFEITYVITPNNHVGVRNEYIDNFRPFPYILTVYNVLNICKKCQ